MPVASTSNTDLASAAPLAWESNRRLPCGVASVLAALRFSVPAPELLQQLSDADWKIALALTDRSGLTLILGAICRTDLPAWVRDRIVRDLANNTERVGRLRAALVEIVERLNARGIQHLLIKGLSQEVDFVADPYLRVGYDIDLFTPPESLLPAREAIESLGYQAAAGTSRFPADHIPPMIRKTGWQWNGDYFDPGIPPCIDLHFRFWDQATEGFPAPGVDDFWARRIQQDGLPVLDRADRLGYAALHLLRHLFRGNPRPYHIYEIAYFLHTHSGDDSFWSAWRETHQAGLRRLEAIAFRLAAAWFGCRLAPVAADAIDDLEDRIKLWFESYAAAPLETQFHPNKHEMWLQFELLDSPRDRARLFVRRLCPATLPVAAANAYVPEEQLTWQLRLRGAAKYAGHVCSRAWYHFRAVPPVISHGLIWKSRAARLPATYWRLLGCSLLYFLGMYQFALLYNLYLLDLGYRENVLGLIASAFTAGCFAGVLPGAAIANRYGLQRSLTVGIAGSAAAFALRAVVSGEPALLVTAFAGGALFSLWSVVLTPAIAAVTPESARPAAFSLSIGSGIALGMAAAMIGGRLPGWFAGAAMGTSAAQAIQWVLLSGSVATALALWPLRRLHIESSPSRDILTYPRGPFIRRFLLAIAVWNLATGAFNPLFNAFFAREFRMPVERIGMVFSLAQAAQVVAILCAPLLLRRLGLTRGVAAMQLATALTLALLASTQVALVAAVLYTSYMSFQYMSEPGIFSSLMNQVPPGQRSGASALSYLVLFGGQTLATALSGGVVARYGYPPMLAGAALLAAFAAWLFWRLTKEKQ